MSVPSENVPVTSTMRSTPLVLRHLPYFIVAVGLENRDGRDETVTAATQGLTRHRVVVVRHQIAPAHDGGVTDAAARAVELQPHG